MVISQQYHTQRCQQETPCPGYSLGPAVAGVLQPPDQHLAVLSPLETHLNMEMGILIIFHKNVLRLVRH